jgi:hypothetical protein
MNEIPTAVLRLIMPEVQRDHLEILPDGKKALPIAIVPRSNLPDGATHAVYQLIPGRSQEEHPVIGYAKPYGNAGTPKPFYLRPI